MDSSFSKLDCFRVAEKMFPFMKHVILEKCVIKLASKTIP